MDENLEEILTRADSYLSWMRHRATWDYDLQRDVDNLIIDIRRELGTL